MCLTYLVDGKKRQEKSADAPGESEATAAKERDTLP
jgi:hypothetical protein